MGGDQKLLWHKPLHVSEFTIIFKYMYESADQETHWLTHHLSHKMFECKKSETESTNYLRDNGSGIVSSGESSYIFSNLQLQAITYECLMLPGFKLLSTVSLSILRKLYM